MPKIPDSIKVKKPPPKGFPLCKQCQLRAVHYLSKKSLCFWCESKKEKAQ